MKVFLFSAIIFLGPILTSHCLLCIYCFTSLGRFTGFYSEYEPNFFQRIARAVRKDYDFSRTDIVFNLLSRLLLLQKRAARLLLDADYSQPSVSLFSKLKWLPIFDLIKLRKLVLLFRHYSSIILMLLFVLNVNSISCLPFVQLVCAPELVLFILRFHTLGLILESTRLLTLLPLFLIALTVILSK